MVHGKVVSFHQPSYTSNWPIVRLALISSRLQIVIGALIRQGSGGGLVHFLLVLGEEILVDLGGRRSQGRGGDELLCPGLASLRTIKSDITGIRTS